eukprot:TRINITY_DN41165_c0_g1_i1.p1 TRINITY_DN41165_c0_g1~~TRINITY_DN41165_c0_g1_i1.p1  ORF type:complete len:295 (+),score=81.06 TRINITY_DN41165_c0_g1_i1:95-979(+)
MLRRRAEELKSPGDEGDEAEENEALIQKDSDIGGGGSESSNGSHDGKRGAGGSGSLLGPSVRSPIALFFTLASICATVWTLPAPTLMGKLELLRHCWRLNTVLDEAALLRSQIEAGKFEKKALEKEFASEQARTADLKRREAKAEGDRKASKTQLSNQEDIAAGLKTTNQDLEVQLEKQRGARLQLLHRLQRLKREELRDLAGIQDPKAPKPVQINARLTATGGESPDASASAGVGSSSSNLQGQQQPRGNSGGRNAGPGFGTQKANEVPQLNPAAGAAAAQAKTSSWNIFGGT